MDRLRLFLKSRSFHDLNYSFRNFTNKLTFTRIVIIIFLIQDSISDSDSKTILEQPEEENNDEEVWGEAHRKKVRNFSQIIYRYNKLLLIFSGEFRDEIQTDSSSSFALLSARKIRMVVCYICHSFCSFLKSDIFKMQI